MSIKYISSTNTITPNHFLTPISEARTPVLNVNDDDMVDQQDEDFSPKRETSAETLIEI